jgi:hypothetical protein
MDVYGHLFESSSERTAEAMEAMYRAALNISSGNIVAIGPAG